MPFAGTGSEAIGALLAGWEHVTMIEQGGEHCEIGEARCRFWVGWAKRSGEREPKRILAVHRKAVKDGDGHLTGEDVEQLRLGLVF
jgi:hypothetical protein